MAMTYKSKYSEYEGCRFVASRYLDNNNLALSIVSDTEGPIATCTVNTGDRLDDSHIAVKNYSENAGMEDFLRGEGIIGRQTAAIATGVVQIPVFELTEKGRELFKGV